MRAMHRMAFSNAPVRTAQPCSVSWPAAAPRFLKTHNQNAFQCCNPRAASRWTLHTNCSQCHTLSSEPDTYDNLPSAAFWVGSPNPQYLTIRTCSETGSVSLIDEVLEVKFGSFFTLHDTLGEETCYHIRLGVDTLLNDYVRSQPPCQEPGYIKVGEGSLEELLCSVLYEGYARSSAASRLRLEHAFQRDSSPLSQVSCKVDDWLTCTTQHCGPKHTEVLAYSSGFEEGVANNSCTPGTPAAEAALLGVVRGVFTLLEERGEFQPVEPETFHPLETTYNNYTAVELTTTRAELGRMLYWCFLMGYYIREYEYMYASASVHAEESYGCMLR